MINRGRYLEALEKAIKRFPITALLGPRQTGKTTLARLLQPAFQAGLLLEVFEENPFLSDFYADRERYAFQTQVFFLLSRYRQQRHTVAELLAQNGGLLADYTFEKDALFARINLKGDELEMYYRVHEALAEKIIPPHLVVYLRADTRVLMQRIAMRDRPYERNMESSYIAELNQAYEQFFADRQDRRSPVLTIDTDDLDYVRRREDLEQVEERIRQALKMAPYQTELPFRLGEKSEFLSSLNGLRNALDEDDDERLM
jgi:deoxyguanosine kinase